MTPAELKAHRDELEREIANLPPGWGDRPLRLRGRRRALSLDVYQKKMAVYRAVKVLILVACQKTTVDVSDLATFHQGTEEAPFLFGRDVMQYIDTLRTRALALRVQYIHLHHPGFGLQAGEDRPATIAENSRTIAWFSEQFRPLDELFAKYIYL
jgi:hypothetical protein